MLSPSDHYNGNLFLNPVPTEVMQPGSFFKVLKGFLNKPADAEPSATPGPFEVDLKALHQASAQDLRVTWIGHSTTLIQLNGKTFLTDPVWANRVSPFRFMGPRRFFPAPLSLEELPPIDHILLSHDHYDHLDKETMLNLGKKNIPVITMLGVGKRLKDWGMAPANITELDWWQEADLGDGFRVTALPARHFSGRWLNDRFKTLWGSFAVNGPVHRVYFGADSGYYDGFAAIGERLGPFDLTMLDTGAYNELWESIHMGPENAVQAHLDLKGRLLLPIHWGTFPLAYHPWTEPIERVMRAAERKGVPLLVPAPGETCDATKSYYSTWWK